MAENWADLPQELLQLCSTQLLLKDRLAFRSVCSTWRAAAFEERFDLPWWMLEDDKCTETKWAEFYSPFSSQIHKVVLPEVKGKRCFSSRGWILTVGTDSEVHMLNPLSRALRYRDDDIIKLPNVNKLSSWDDEISKPEVDKFILSASPASSPNYTVMVIYWPSGPLAFWKPGNEEWKTLTPPAQYDDNKYNDDLEDSDLYVDKDVLDVIYYRGQFVAVNSSGSIFTCDVDGPDPTAQVILEMPLEFRDLWKHSEDQYLAESAGRLLLVSQLSRPERYSSVITGFRVFDVDLDTREWKELESMGKVSFFVGFNSSFSVRVDDNKQGIKPNCVYFTGFGGIGTYYMEDKRIEFDQQADYNSYPPPWIESPPLWIEPSF
ncbi:putative F-box protein At3g25750 [Syzygium oleosum]|uniref:putative F-box protein At3g25750 n=1 Tax=Syzygium oleosum TaxID=219896 RepID=UPI0024BAAC91|nr:putative F-box protein At3g25750 [Syzygium oleosum]